MSGAPPWNGWPPPPDEVGAVDSVFTRTGDVVAVAGDYDTDLVDNASGVAGATTSDALDALAAAIAALPTPPAAPYYGNLAGIPAPGNAGRSGTITDGRLKRWIDDGAAWRPTLGSQILTRPPLIAGFTAVNVGAGTYTDRGGSIQCVGVNDGGTVTVRGQALAADGTNTDYCEAAFQFDPLGSETTFSLPFIALRESGTAKAYLVTMAQDFVNRRSYFEKSQMTSNNTRTNVVSKGYANWDSMGPIFYRVRRDATLCYFEVSRDSDDPNSWIQFDNAAIATVFTTAPDQVMFGICGLNIVPRATLVHWKNGHL